MKIEKASNKRAQHTAIVSARDGKSIGIDREVLIERTVLEVFFILVFNQKGNEVLHDLSRNPRYYVAYNKLS